MQENFSTPASRKGARRIPTGLGFALTVSFLHLTAGAQEVNLGTANNFEVLSAAGITSTGGTVINGSIGTSPITGAAITGLIASQVNGTIYTVNSAGPAGSVMNPGLLGVSATGTPRSGRSPKKRRKMSAAWKTMIDVTEKARQEKGK
jgi:hypothetical protein